MPGAARSPVDRPHPPRDAADPTRRPPGWLVELLPEGTRRPESIPPDIFDAALTKFVACERLDMSDLAEALTIGRSTLYRRVGDRDHLLGEVLWYVARQELVSALRATRAITGHPRVQRTVELFLSAIHPQRPLLRLLDAEPEIALRILTSKYGPVQSGCVGVLQRMLEQEIQRGNLRLILGADALAYAIVRLSESYVFADIIAGREPVIDEAIALVGTLLRGSVERRARPR